MKKLILLLSFVFCNLVFAQPTILYTGLNNTTPAPSNNRYNLVDKGIFKQYRFQANQSAATSTLGWAFHIGSTGVPNYSANWRASSPGNTLSLNNFIAVGFANGANYTNNGGVDGLLPTISNNNYYTFNVDSGSGNVNYAMSLLETTYNPTALTGTTVVTPASSNGSAKVTINAASPLNAGEYVYMRYSSNGFATSTFIEIPFVGAIGTFFMPCFAGGTTINYYFFSSNKTFGQINTDFTNFAVESVYDMATLNLLNNGGPNYNYTQPSTAATNFSGNYYIPSTCYPTLASFLTPFNAGNLIGQVTVNIAAGYAESAPASGFQITKAGTLANTITFKKDGVGVNPTFTASSTPSIGTLNDAIFKIIGADYVTLDGLTIKENSANVNFIANSTNNMAEFGVALFYNTTTDGAQNNTIQNCDISLNKNYTNTFGIYSNTNHDRTLATTAIASLAGGNSNNKVYSNAISNVNIGIAFIGTNAFYDAGNDIGGTATTTGNTITNQGSNVAPVTNYSGMPGTSVMSIYVGNCTGSNISYNNITGTTCANNNYGIQLRSNGTLPTITHTTNINNNTISGLASSATISYNLFGIWNDSMGGTGHTLNINNNSVTNLTTSNAGFVGSVVGIWTSGAVNTININSNTISGFTIAGASLPTALSSRCAALKSSGIVTGAINFGSNNVTNFAYNNTGTGDIVMLDVSGNYTGTCLISNNIVDGVTHSGSGSVSFYSNAGPSTGALTISSNNFKNIDITGAGGTGNAFIRFVSSGTGASQTLTINANNIENLRVNPSASSSGITGILTSISSTVSVYNNTIKNLNSLSTNIGIQTGGGSTTHNVYGNTIDGMSSNAGGGVNHYGIRSGSSTGTTNIYNNKVYNITTGTSTNAYIFGIEVSNGTNSNVYNNMVADLKMPNVSITAVCSLRAITISIATNSNIYNNSVYLTGTSSGTDFSSTAFSYSGTTTTDVKNNIFVNNVTPKGQGFAAAMMRLATGTNGTISPNFAATSNNNCLFAKSVTNGVIYVEGQYTAGGPTNIIPANCFDLTAYKTYMTGGRETASFSEIPPFVSTTPTTMDLHLNTATGSGCFNGGQTIALVTNDIDNIARPIGGVYDIGADEAAGTLIPRTPPTITYTPITDLGCSAAVTLTVTITTPGVLGFGATAPRLYYKKLSDANFNFATANTNAVSGWKYVVATGSGPFNFAFDYSLLTGGFVSDDTLQYFVAAQDTNGNVATTSANVQTCPTSVVFTSSQSTSALPTINQFTFKASYSGAYTVGTAGNFLTLTGTNGLFDSINKGLVSGNITATIISNIAENGIVALKQWSEFNTISCLPIAVPSFRLTVQSDGTVRTISGTDLVYDQTTLPALITLNNADRVTFSGGTATDRKLVFRNTNTISVNCNPVFQFGNGTLNIVVNNCDIQSNGSESFAPLYSSGVHITTGTNSIVLQRNDFHNATAGTLGNLRFGVFALNNPTTTLQILDNNFFNISSTAIQIGVGFAPDIGNGQIITGNSIYDTGAGVVNATFTGIDIRGTASSGHTISNNFIGGQTPNGGVSGSPFTNASITTFKGIYLPYHPTTGISNITNNQITNINLSNTTGAAFSGIDFTGLINCNGNTIGHATNPAMGITIGATTATVFSNNYGIIGGSGAAVSGINFTNNTIKYIKHNTNGAAATTSRLIGIYNYFTGASGVTININNNIVAEMSSNMKNTSDLNQSGNAFAVGNIAGILSGTTSFSGIDVKDNLIFNLSNTGLSGTNRPNVVGIAIDGNTPSNILRNRIYGLTNQSPGSGANPSCIMGIRLQPSTSIVANNMITLTNGSNTNASRIIGIFDNANNLDVYFNTVYIGGSQTTNGTTGICSAPYLNITSSGIKNIKNNIFHNVRTGVFTAGTTAFHYALANTVNGSTFISNYNDLLNGDLNTLCLNNNLSYNIAAWRLLATPATPDVNSLAIVPSYLDLPNGDLHLVTAACSPLILIGTPIATVLNDFDSQTRSTTTPTIGADESSGVTTNWNGTAWNNGLPTLTTLATISGLYDMNPLGDNRPSFDACSLIINSGTVNVTANKYINIQKDLTINNAAILNVLDKGSLVMIDLAGTVTNNGTGIANVTRTTPNMQLYDYTYWSSPMVTDNLGTRFTNWNTNSIYNFSTQNYSDLFSGAAYPQTTGIPDSFDDNGNDWTKVTTPVSTTMAPTVGYAIMAATTGSFPRTETVTFSGKLNTGDKTFPLKLSANNASNVDDFNLVGNPYPSSIFADDFINDNLPNISGTIYFWTHIGNLEPALTNPGPNISNYNNNDYALYNLSGPTGTGSPSGSLSATPDGYIGIGQGFFVESETNSNDLVFSNSMRSSSYSNSQFFRNSNQPVQKDRLWLNFENIDNMFSQQLIAYLPETTTNYDMAYDGLGNKTPNYVNFYSFINNDTSLAFKIQSRNTFNENDTVALGYSSAVSGQTSISIDRFEGIFENQNIYLQDNLLNITHDLKQTAYTFTTNYGTFNDRFILKYTNTALANNTFVNDEETVNIYVKDSKISVASISNKIQSIQIFDILGRNIYENKTVNLKTFTVDNLSVSNQTLIVKTKVENGKITTKKIVL